MTLKGPALLSSGARLALPALEAVSLAFCSMPSPRRPLPLPPCCCARLARASPGVPDQRQQLGSRQKRESETLRAGPALRCT